MSLVLLLACGEPGLVGPPYNLHITELIPHSKSFRITRKYADGKTREITVDQSFEIRGLKFNKYNEWRWSRAGRPASLLTSGWRAIQGVPCKAHQRIYFHPNGNLRRCLIGLDKWKYGRFKAEDKDVIEFHPNGKLKLLTLAVGSSYRKDGFQYAVVRFNDKGEFIADRPPELRHEIRKIK